MAASDVSATGARYGVPINASRPSVLEVSLVDVIAAVLPAADGASDATDDDAVVDDNNDDVDMLVRTVVTRQRPTSHFHARSY